MNISTNKLLLEAATQCSNDYQAELKASEGIDKFESTASWKEIAFFIKGAMWMKSALKKEMDDYLNRHVSWVYQGEVGEDGSPICEDYINFMKERLKIVKAYQEQFQEEIFQQFD